MDANFLRSGEQILWEGAPEPFRLLDRCVTPALLRDILVSFAGAVFIAAECWLLSGSRPGPAILWIALLLIGVPIAHTVLDTVKLRKTKYYATNQRLLVVNRDVRDVEYPRIQAASLSEDRVGHTSLLCGEKAIHASDSSYRERTVFGLDALLGDDTPCDSFAFYAVDRPDSLKQVLLGRGLSL